MTILVGGFPARDSVRGPLYHALHVKNGTFLPVPLSQRQQISIQNMSSCTENLDRSTTWDSFSLHGRTKSESAPAALLWLLAPCLKNDATCRSLWRHVVNLKLALYIALDRCLLFPTLCSRSSFSPSHRLVYRQAFCESGNHKSASVWKVGNRTPGEISRWDTFAPKRNREQHVTGLPATPRASLRFIYVRKPENVDVEQDVAKWSNSTQRKQYMRV